uniref:Uncharacterized protein n=1 Tax=Plectus sambesii TaxID=2011161 RepID=A0A914W472_9BILA
MNEFGGGADRPSAAAVLAPTRTCDRHLYAREFGGRRRRCLFDDTTCDSLADRPAGSWSRASARPVLNDDTESVTPFLRCSNRVSVCLYARDRSQSSRPKAPRPPAFLHQPPTTRHISATARCLQGSIVALRSRLRAAWRRVVVGDQSAPLMSAATRSSISMQCCSRRRLPLRRRATPFVVCSK